MRGRNHNRPRRFGFCATVSLHPASAAAIKASEGRLPLLIAISLRGIARRDDPRRAVDHHRPLAGAAREGGTNRGRGTGADVVGLISEHARQRADLERHLHRVVDRRVPRSALAKQNGSIEGRDSDCLLYTSDAADE